MTGLVYRSLGDVGDSLVILDATRRLYAGLSRDKAYWHVVTPALEDMVNADNAVIRSTGQLTCRCRGGLYRGTCWRVKEAEAFEAGTLAPTHRADCDADLRRNGCVCMPDIAWLADNDSPAGAGESVEAFRG